MRMPHDVRRAIAPVRRTLLPAAMILAAVVACTDATGPAPSAIVRVDADTIHAQRYQAGSVAWLRFVVPVTIENPSSSSVFLQDCMYGVEQPDGAQWRRVWSPICSLGASAGTEVRAGEQLALTLPVDAATSGPGAPEWNSAAIAGTYRLAVSLVTSRRDITTVQAKSDAFLLVVAAVP